MTGIYVLAEHRQGELREVTLEMLSKGKELAEKTGKDLTAVLLGYNADGIADRLKDKANKVIYVNDAKLENFNSEAYQKVLKKIFEQDKPYLTMVGHTAFGMDLAPSLATALETPVATDCVDVSLDGGSVKALRQAYAGKINLEVALKKAENYMVTVRPSSFQIEDYSLSGEVVKMDSPLTEDITSKKFIEYLETAVGDVDITEAEILVSVGRGIKDAENIPLVQGFADALGATLSCSRPVVDKNWLPKNRQVGTSGKTVKPKVYIAVGISGAFQHTAGMKGAGTIIAINKDPKAPIFNIAHYGIVGDLFKVLPGLTEKVKEIIK